MIRVLQVVTIMNRGGIESMLMNLYRSIDREKIQFDFLVHRKEQGSFDDEIRELGGNIYYVPAINPIHHRKYLRALDLFFAEHKYEIVHSHLNPFSMYILRAAQKAGISSRVAHSHTDDWIGGIKYPFIKYCKWKLPRYTTKQFACSEKAGKWLFGDTPFQIMHNTIDLKKNEFNNENRILYKNQLGLNDSFVLGHIGRFSKVKNHSFLIDIFAEVVKKQKNAKLLLIGDGALKSEIEQKVNRLNLSDRILFLGVRKDIPELLSCMDVFVFPSLREGLPVTLIEAQASGIQIFCSNTIDVNVKCVDSVHFISLKKTPEFWANEILEYNSGYERKSYLAELQNAGYDVVQTAKWLEDFYLKAIENCEN